MEPTIHPRQSWIPTLDRAGWSRVADRIIHGLCHDLAGRVGSISGLTFLLDSQDGGASSVLPFLEEEVAQLDDAVRLLRLLPDDATTPELLAPGELLGDLTLMVRAQRGLENVGIGLEGFAAAPAVRIDRTFFIRSLMVLLTAVAERVVLEGEDGLMIRASNADGGLSLEVSPAPDPDPAPQTDPGKLPFRAVGAMGLQIWEEALKEQGVEVRRGNGEAAASGVQVVFPSPSGLS